MHFASLYLTQKLSFVKSKCDDPKIKIWCMSFAFFFFDNAQKNLLETVNKINMLSWITQEKTATPKVHMNR